MKILITLTNLQIGGAQLFALQLAYALKNKGHQVIIYSHYPDYDVLLIENMKVRSLNNYPFLYRLVWFINAIFKKFKLKYNFRDKINELYYRLVIKSFQPDIINSQMSYSDYVTANVLLQLKSKKIKFIPTLHGEYELGLGKKESVELLNKITYGLIYTTEKNLLCFQNYDKPKHHVGIGLSDNLIKNYLMSISRKDLNIPEEDFVFGMIARGIPEKGWEHLINSFIEINLRYPQTSLLLIGDGSYLRDLVKQKRHPKIFLFQLDGRPLDFFSYIPLIDVGVLPTYFKGESYPNIIVQYIYFEKPVIASDIGEIKNILNYQNKSCGILLSLRNDNIDSIELTGAMIDIMKNDVYQNFQNHCKQIKDRFNIDRIAEQYEIIFHQDLKR